MIPLDPGIAAPCLETEAQRVPAAETRPLGRAAPRLWDWAQSHLTLNEANALEQLREKYDDAFILSLWEGEASKDSPVGEFVIRACQETHARVAGFLERNPRKRSEAA